MTVKIIIWLLFSDLHGINGSYFDLKELMRAVANSVQCDMLSYLMQKQPRKGSGTHHLKWSV